MAAAAGREGNGPGAAITVVPWARIWAVKRGSLVKTVQCPA